MHAPNVNILYLFAMIETTLSTVLMIYLLLTLGILLALWATRHYKRRKIKLLCVAEQIACCEYCQYSYLKKIAATLSRCPQCKSFNRENAK